MQLQSGKRLLKRLAGRAKAVCNAVGRRAWDIVTVGVKGALNAFEKVFERGKSAYEKLEPRLAARAALLMAWWERRGLPLALLRLAWNALIHLPIDIGWYLLACVEHLIGLNPPYLLAWLVFAGSVRAWRFYCKEILPGQRKAGRVGKAENGTQIEGGS